VLIQHNNQNLVKLTKKKKGEASQKVTIEGGFNHAWLPFVAPFPLVGPFASCFLSSWQ